MLNPEVFQVKTEILKVAEVGALNNWFNEAEEAEPIEKKNLYFHLTNKNNHIVESSLLAQKKGGKGLKLEMQMKLVTSSMMADNFWYSPILFLTKEICIA